MTQNLFTTLFSQPLYNGLIFLMHLVPGADAGIAVILFTIIVRLILYPLSKRSIQTQQKMRAAEGDIQQIRAKYKDKTEQANRIMQFYKEKGLNPLAGFFLIIIQIPIIFALYRVFLQSGLPSVDNALLYAFVSAPAAVNMHFLGLIDISMKSYVLAFIAAASQYLQIRISMPVIKPAAKSNGTFKDDFARSMSLQMRYLFPVMAFFIVYNLSGTIALYWITNNAFAIAQEWYVRRRTTAQTQLTRS